MTNLKSQVKAALKTLPPFKKVVVGLSGGMDSVVLTHILKSMGYDIIVAHLNHQLRGPEADRDEAFVVALAKKWNLPYICKKAVIPERENIEGSARHLRYSFLEAEREAYQADLIAVAHHFDDQMETIIMHQKRGAGLRGRRGMGLLTGKVLRPFIDIPRREIAAYAMQHQLEFVLDSSNYDLRLERNKLREELMPELKKLSGFEERMREISREAAIKLKLIEKAKQSWKKQFISGRKLDRTAFNQLDTDMKAEVLLDILGQEDIYGSTFNRLIDFIANGKTGKELRIKTLTFVIEYDSVRWYLKAPKKLSKKPVEGAVQWGDYTIRVSHIKPLFVRPWKTGDRFQPAGMKGTKKLQDFFTDQKVPKYSRRQIPIIVDDQDAIICIGDLRFSEKHKHLKDKISIQKNG
ncbi:tRNA lysidine(34) synthetase TilS [Candidatus Peregrinibacteria bacterium]|nr:tRNA lysidine(34) synthetase TilS [Candidatus Peregrinibacteria bacterium]